VKHQGSKWNSAKGRIRHFDYRLSIRVKLTLILIVILLVILPFVAVSLHYNNLSYNTVQGMERFSEIARICETISFFTLKIDGNLKNYIVLHDSHFIEKAREDLVSLKELANDAKEFGFRDNFTAIIKDIDRYSSLLDSLKIVVSKEEIPAKRIERDLAKYKAKHDSLISEILLARTEAIRDSLMKELKQTSESFDVSKIFLGKEQSAKKQRAIMQLDLSKRAIDTKNATILGNAKRKLKEYTEIAEQYASKGARNIWVVLLLTIGFVTYLIIVLPERIVIPIRRLSNFVKRIEKGELNASIKGFPRDEIGELVHNLSRMVHQVRKIDGLKTQKIHESERKVKFLVNAISEGVIVLSDELRIHSINKPAMRIIGCDSEKMEEKSLEGIESLQHIKTSLEGVFKSGDKVDELACRGKDTEDYTIKVWSIRDAAGKVSGVMLLFIKTARA